MGRYATYDFCEEHSVADFREYFLLDEKRVLYKLYDLSHYDVCSSPSLSQHTFNLWSGREREPEMVTVEEYMKRLLKKIENRYFAEIWSWWKESPGSWQGDLAEGELRDQEFYDNIFEQVKAFLGRDLAKMLGDYTAHMSASSIRDFVMARLLPLGSTVWKERRRTVEGNTIVKLLKFIRCSWDCTRSRGFYHLGDRILHHTPKTTDGFDGLDIGGDMKNDLQKLKTKAADQLATIATRLQLSVEEFQGAFNARRIPKAVSKAKQMRLRMEYGLEPSLEKMLAEIVKQAQTEAFWRKLDEAIHKLCYQRSQWLNEIFLEHIVPEIENVVAGVNNHTRFSGRPNGRMDINDFFLIQLNAISDWIIHQVAAIAEGPGPAPLSDPRRLLPHWDNGTIQDPWPFSTVLPAFREAFELLEPTSGPGRFSIRDALDLGMLGDHFDNTAALFIGFAGFIGSTWSYIRCPGPQCPGIDLIRDERTLWNNVFQ